MDIKPFLFTRLFTVCAALAVFIGCASCSAKNTALFSAASAEQQVPAHDAVSVAPYVDTDPRAEQIRAVIGGLSARAQAAITIAHINDFMTDLDAVLASDSPPAGEIPLLVLVDKKHQLPDGYAPRDIVRITPNTDYNINRSDLSLRREAYDALTAMARAARRDGITLLVSSTYRSYEYQVRLYNRYVAEDGQELADRYSARPGTSQHQLGTVIDFGSITDDFAKTHMYAWLEEHASQYGWSLSFPDGYEDVTGFMWECWHFRYIGATACAFQKKYFGDIQQFMIEFIDAWKTAHGV
ncbi:MAG: M15 family metallopeptidase [Treponema sp.]|nr:M15 family metallopeptidase [Treponema sp.]